LFAKTTPISASISVVPAPSVPEPESTVPVTVLAVVAKLSSESPSEAAVKVIPLVDVMFSTEIIIESSSAWSPPTTFKASTKIASPSIVVKAPAALHYQHSLFQFF
jgi:hypothetical protein